MKIFSVKKKWCEVVVGMVKLLKCLMKNKWHSLKNSRMLARMWWERNFNTMSMSLWTDMVFWGGKNLVICSENFKNLHTCWTFTQKSVLKREESKALAKGMLIIALLITKTLKMTKVWIIEDCLYKLLYLY